jgi:hypothetical protein
MDQKIGSWAFIIGAVVAILAGVAGSAVVAWAGPLTLLLVVLGLIVGFLNVTPHEATPFIVASVGLIVAGSANLTVINDVVPTLGTILNAILGNIVVLIAPAVIIVGLKAVHDLAKA